MRECVNDACEYEKFKSLCQSLNETGKISLCTCSRAAVHRLRSFVIDCLTIIRISAKLKDKTTSQTVNDRLHTRLRTLGSLSHNFKSSSECTKAAFALLIGLLNDWAPFSRNAIFKLARETVSQKNKPLLTRVGYPLTTEQVSGRGFRFFINFEWRLFLIKDICLAS